MTAGNDNALIIFSRLPIGHETKTRLAPLLNETQRSKLHLAMWRDIFGEALKLRNTDIYLYWTGSGNISDWQKYIPCSFILRKQEGENLGERMRNAMRDIFALRYKRAVIIGSDIPSVKAENIARAFGSLNDSDAVIGPSSDGGYWLIGMRKFIPEAFGISSWGNSSVLAETVRTLAGLGISCGTADTLDDLDTPEDVIRYRGMNSDTCTGQYISSDTVL
ncbi:MAG: TIGR04282 family arsenosugar biosynthesis glycosyltransferase [Synergistaceae bacterium]|nr:TIGR04282 family arsenosugar biosynthesis glycosyltransferase [Synergistaceae bacterium]